MHHHHACCHRVTRACAPAPRAALHGRRDPARSAPIGAQMAMHVLRASGLASGARRTTPPRRARAVRRAPPRALALGAVEEVTLQASGKLLVVFGVGAWLQRAKLIPDEAAKVCSKVLAHFAWWHFRPRCLARAHFGRAGRPRAAIAESCGRGPLSGRACASSKVLDLVERGGAGALSCCPLDLSAAGKGGLVGQEARGWSSRAWWPPSAHFSPRDVRLAVGGGGFD